MTRRDFVQPSQHTRHTRTHTQAHTHTHTDTGTHTHTDTGTHRHRHTHTHTHTGTHTSPAVRQSGAIALLEFTVVRGGKFESVAGRVAEYYILYIIMAVESLSRCRAGIICALQKLGSHFAWQCPL